jgi:UPF0755 protein
MEKLNIKFNIVIALIALFVIGGAVFVAYALQRYDAPEGQENGTRFFIPAGSDDDAILDTLQSALGDSYGKSVYRLWAWQGGDADKAHGSYVVEPSSSALTLSRRLKYNRQTPIKVTFNCLRELKDLADLVAAKLEMDDLDFIEACDTVLTARGYSAEQYPAAFFPDTYEFYWTASPSHVVKEMADVRDRFWNDSRRAKAKALGLTPVEVTTVASIVEEETAKSDERPKVARLYLNRLAKGMKLQADPTVKFAVGDFSLQRITGKHIATDSPYNTYRVNGLPPGPIRIVDRRTVDDVLNAPQHGYIYMCAKEDFSGYHNFATDFATHQANARRYQAELNKRNIN